MTFDFTPSFSVPLPKPEEIKATRANELPFKAQFTEVEERAQKGEQPHYFIPTRYWTAARGVPAEKATFSYAKEKIRNQFAAWRKAEGSRAKLELISIERTGKEGIEGIKEPGLSYWLIKEN